jgi:regulator of cell morphogenesis and NO signaling
MKMEKNMEKNLISETVRLETVADIVRADYRSADVFRQYGINYCCSGQITIKEACSLKNINEEELLGAISQATRNVFLPNSLRVKDWKLDFLVDYLLHVHHAFLSETITALQSGLAQFADGHQKKYPEISAIEIAFGQLAQRMRAHLLHEQDVIFPYLKQMENAWKKREIYGSLFVRTLRKPLVATGEEHKLINRNLEMLRKLTLNYSFPVNACTNYQVLFQKLKALDNDLSQLLFLEQTILYPGAIKLESELLQFKFQ